MNRTKVAFDPGDVIAERYRVERLLGRGGMGMVYCVQDGDSGERLALKTLLPQFAEDVQAIRRFGREVTAIRQLHHPCIVRIHEARRWGDLLFYTMDYVEGTTLRRWMQKKGRLGMGSTVRILALLSDALEHAHTVAVHRDLSPENVMLVGDGSIRLLDFGLAKLTDPAAAFTRVGVSLGKICYIAPEQHMNAVAADRRADLYSLGIMFYEMLSGQFPKPGVKLTDLVPSLLPECNEFVARATAHSPEQRFPDAREFRIALMGLYERHQRRNEAAGAAVPQPAAASVTRRPWAFLHRLLGRLAFWRSRTTV